ncbi:cap [Macaca mulatta feces associated virus 5]|nr:cap [Macaca mulatta feces associated virus 5]
MSELPSPNQESGHDTTPSKPGQPSMPYIPPIYVACIVMPPSKLQQLYYRIRVDWAIEFSEIRPISEIMDWLAMSQFGNTVYFSDYATAHTLSTTTNTVDTTQVNINKVM